MKIGTRSVLYGAHAFWLHPFLLAIAWWRLYGFPWDYRLWFAFILHDIGYLEKPDMDGDAGETHPILGAAIMARLFGSTWGEFTLLHSRYYANRVNKPISKLCIADKYAIVITPSWLYLPLVWLSGELKEYMGLSIEGKYAQRGFDKKNPWRWYNQVKAEMRQWVAFHKDLPPNSWMNPNGCSVEEPTLSKLPGYLDGGYEPKRYLVLKADGSLVDPKAKYMVFRYDKDRDPNAIFACLAYAVSVSKVNPTLSDGIIEALREELNLSQPEFQARYTDILHSLHLVAGLFETASVSS